MLRFLLNDKLLIFQIFTHEIINKILHETLFIDKEIVIVFVYNNTVITFDKALIHSTNNENEMKCLRGTIPIFF